MRRKVDAMEKLLDASRTIANLDPLQVLPIVTAILYSLIFFSFKATNNIVTETCRILNCDRATIFTLDEAARELVLCVAEGAKNIRVPLGQVAYESFYSLHCVMLSDVY